MAASARASAMAGIAPRTTLTEEVIMSIRDMIILALIFTVANIAGGYIRDINTFNIHDARYGKASVPMQLGLRDHSRGSSSAQTRASSYVAAPSYPAPSYGQGFPAFGQQPYSGGVYPQAGFQ